MISPLGAMRRCISLATMVFVLVAHPTSSAVSEYAPQAIADSALQWVNPAPVPGLSFAWLQGDETANGPYTIRVKLLQGTQIPPHNHPDERISTVLSGTLYVGFGEVFTPSALVAIRSGEAYIAPRGVTHFILAKDGPVVYQESGVGPTGTVMVKGGD